MNQLESTFEKRVMKTLRAQGCFVAHFGGPEGWCDLISIKHHSARLFELKSIREKNWEQMELRDVFELSQPAFIIANPMLHIMALIQTIDGVFMFGLTQEIARKIPQGIRFNEIGFQPWDCHEP